jgi:hypothetical protein
MTNEELVFLYETHKAIYESQKQKWVRNLTKDVFEGFKAIHEKYISVVIGNNNCTSCMFNMVKAVYFYADKYQKIDKSTISSNVESDILPVTDSKEHTSNKKPKKKK